MTHGIVIYNEGLQETFNSNKKPYRFAAAVTLEINVPYPSTPHWKRYRADVTQYFEDDNIYSVVFPSGVPGSYSVINEGGRWWAYASFGYEQDTTKIITPRPILYIFNRKEAGSGGSFGIETFDVNGIRTMSSNNPLLQILEYKTVNTEASPKQWEIVWTLVGPSTGRLLVVETTDGSTSQYYPSYTGGGDFTYRGWFVTTMEQSGHYYIQAAKWEETMGESSIERSYAEQLRIALIAKP